MKTTKKMMTPVSVESGILAFWRTKSNANKQKEWLFYPTIR